MTPHDKQLRTVLPGGARHRNPGRALVLLVVVALLDGFERFDRGNSMNGNEGSAGAYVEQAGDNPKESME